MPRILLSLLLALLSTLLAAGTTSAQTAPQFQLGFRALATALPELVGTPVESEHFDPISGDSIQHTTTGVMVWRKADNVTAFTNGSTTWLIGPSGVQSRPNSARFDWEKRETPVVLPASAVSLAFSRTADGTWSGQGSAQNPLSTAMDVEINATGYAPGGTAVVDAPTVFVLNLVPANARAFSVTVPARTEVARWEISVLSHPTSARTGFSIEVGAGNSLNVSHMLAGAVAMLRSVDSGAQLVKAAAENDVKIAHGATSPGVLGDYNPSTNVITISDSMDGESARVRATVLSHELQHAVDRAQGSMPTTPLQCYQEEATAFERQAEVWTALWRNNLPPGFDEMHREMNDVADTMDNDQQAFVSQLVQRYRSECGPIQHPSLVMQGR